MRVKSTGDLHRPFDVSLENVDGPGLCPCKDDSRTNNRGLEEDERKIIK